MYLALWLIRRWRLPATPCLILPVAVSLKRFLTPLFVLSLGIFVSFDVSEQPRQPNRPGRSSISSRVLEAGAYREEGPGRQGPHQGIGLPSKSRKLPERSRVRPAMTRRRPAMLSSRDVGAWAPPMSVCTQPGWSIATARSRPRQSMARLRQAALRAALDER